MRLFFTRLFVSERKQIAMIALLEIGNLPAFVLAPVSGILMAGATASTQPAALST
jgi:hypothetical protein